ncbi:hypothetical protein [Streptomyces sp. NPDC093109]|uniref:hypothetical protein n=1 Tax=Streptomyces sp. NPDC093109 TaxID=3154977 RepID=UPI00344DE84F
MDYQIGSSCHRQLTNGKDTWSARCGESRTPGAESGSGKRTGRKVGTAPRPDSTGAFYRSALYPLLGRINAYLVRWMRKKYKRLQGHKKARDSWERAIRLRPGFFAHWRWVTWAPAVW